MIASERRPTIVRKQHAVTGTAVSKTLQIMMERRKDDFLFPRVDTKNYITPGRSFGSAESADNYDREKSTLYVSFQTVAHD